MPHLVDFPAEADTKPARFTDFLIKGDGSMFGDVPPDIVLATDEIYVRFERRGLISIYLTMNACSTLALDSLVDQFLRDKAMHEKDQTYYSFVEEKFAVRTATAHDFKGFIQRVAELKILAKAYESEAMATHRQFLGMLAGVGPAYVR